MKFGKEDFVIEQAFPEPPIRLRTIESRLSDHNPLCWLLDEDRRVLVFAHEGLLRAIEKGRYENVLLALGAYEIDCERNTLDSWIGYVGTKIGGRRFGGSRYANDSHMLGDLAKAWLWAKAQFPDTVAGERCYYVELI